jgi:putative oxidoreductase
MKILILAGHSFGSLPTASSSRPHPQFEGGVMGTGDHIAAPSSLRFWFISVQGWLGRFPLSIIQLAMRIGVGSVYFKAGLLKFNSPESTVALFQSEYKVPLLDPALAAHLSTYVEIIFPVLLFLGLATRIATLPLLGEIAVIELFVYPLAWTDHLVWGSILLFLLTRGPGALSVDHLIDRYFLKRN